MPGQLHDTAPVTGTARRADYGSVRLGRRDIDGLLLCAEHYGAPYDLLAVALSAQPARLRGITARWRRRVRCHRAAGTRPGLVLAHPGRDGCRRAGLPGHPSHAGAAGAHPRCAGSPAVAPGRPGLDPGPGLVAVRAAPARRRPFGVGIGHLPDAEIHWPSVPDSPYAGQLWAIEAELTPKPLARTARIMGGLLSPPRYARIPPGPGGNTSPLLVDMIVSSGGSAAPRRSPVAQPRFSGDHRPQPRREQIIGRVRWCCA
jgi:hypothetical protein